MITRPFVLKTRVKIANIGANRLTSQTEAKAGEISLRDDPYERKVAWGSEHWLTPRKSGPLISAGPYVQLRLHVNI